MGNNQIATTNRTGGKLIERFAGKYGVDAGKMLNTLKLTAFQSDKPISDEQMMALLIVAEQYGLNPFTKELYAFPDKKKGIIPIVSVDGWIRIVNTHEQYNGVAFIYSEEMVRHPDGEHQPCHEWVECIIHRKDRDHSVVVREYFDECYREPFKSRGNNGEYTVNGPWQTHAKRFLRHKAWIQCARLAFGFAGIYDQDEAERIVEGTHLFENQAPQGKPQTREPEPLNPEPAGQQSADVIEDAEVIEASQEQATPAERSEPTLSPHDIVDISNQLIQMGLSPSDLERHFGMALAKMPLAMHAQISEWLKGQRQQRQGGETDGLS